ncbi:hypothetical protein KC909_03015 [Candidatus Dojkabacteria bacterium]|uniref:Uncharacterized protein n=1 Tax=Candidatus Dojkabacteria bacterium TaxID=2099670 RepID=A0A955RJF0_9BACT|nr:hypothetical protein [Candidatus Dojkabacteria bacterium]
MSEENWLTTDHRGADAQVIWNGLSHITDDVIPHLTGQFPDFADRFIFEEIIGRIAEFKHTKAGFFRVNDFGVDFQLQDFDFPIIRVAGDQIFFDTYYYPDSGGYATSAQVGNEFEVIDCRPEANQ